MHPSKALGIYGFHALFFQKFWDIVGYNIITVNQSAFILGWFITKNALLAFECFHAMKRCKDGCSNAFALKLDMSKAYDRVD